MEREGVSDKINLLEPAERGNGISRVAARVVQGGHDIPEDVIRRRFDMGLRNFHNLYRPLVDEWFFLDNSEDKPVLLDEGVNQ